MKEFKIVGELNLTNALVCVAQGIVLLFCDHCLIIQDGNGTTLNPIRTIVFNPGTNVETFL